MLININRISDICFTWRFFLKVNMPSIEQSFSLLNTRTICVIFLYNWTQCIDGFSLLQRYVRKGNDERTQQFSDLFVTERTQLKATDAQLLEKLRPIALTETCRFLTIQSLEFWEIWQKKKKRLGSTWLIYQEKSEFWHREFFIIQKTINGELQKSPMSKFY